MSLTELPPIKVYLFPLIPYCDDIIKILSSLIYVHANKRNAII